MFLFFFFKQKTAYEMRISDWSSDVCSSDLYLGLITSEDDVAGAQARRPSIEKSRRYKGHPRLAQICLELVHLREAFENDRIVAAECQTSPGKAKRDIDQQDIRQCREGPMIIEPICGQFVDKSHRGRFSEIGRAHVCTPVTNAHLVCSLLLE